MKDIIKNRRAYRALGPIDVDDDLIFQLAQAAQLAPSCFNNQPWRFLFIYEEKILQNIREGISRGNEWVFDSSLIIAVFSHKDYDCKIKKRRYYLFDTGIASAFLILRATEMGLIAHPIAGYNEEKLKDILNIPTEMKVIALIVIGRHDDKKVQKMNDSDRHRELNRPERLSIEKIIYRNSF